MLSIFPLLFTFSAVAPIILRAGLGIVLILTGYGKIKNSEQKKKEKVWGYAQILSALLLILGFLLQPAAILSGLIAICDLLKGNRPNMERNILIIAISLSLLALGPGLFAFDLPF